MEELEAYAKSLSQECPVRRGLGVLGGKWAMLIVYALVTERLRFGELRRNVTGISEKMLTQELKKLEYAGLVLRTDYDETPPKVDYSLTQLGQEAMPVIEVFAQYGGKLSE